MRISRYAAAVPLLALPALPVALAPPASAHGWGDDADRPRADRYLGPLDDLHPEGADVTDDGAAGAIVWTSPWGTFAWFGLAALDPAAVGRTYGAHIHSGPCIAGDPDAAGPHLNAGDPPSPETEVWLDVTVHEGGWGGASAAVPFTIPEGGAGSIVVHARATDPATGDAGDRLACIPLDRL